MAPRVLKTYTNKSLINTTKSTKLIDVLFAKNLQKGKNKVGRKKAKVIIKELPPRCEEEFSLQVTHNSVNVTLEDTFDKLLKAPVYNKVKVQRNYKPTAYSSDSDLSKSKSIIKNLTVSFHSPVIHKKYKRAKQKPKITIESKTPIQKSSKKDALTNCEIVIEVNKPSAHKRLFDVENIDKSINISKNLNINNSEISSENIFTNTFKEKLRVHSSTPLVTTKAKKIAPGQISPISKNGHLNVSSYIKQHSPDQFKGYSIEDLAAANNTLSNLTISNVNNTTPKNSLGNRRNSYITLRRRKVYASDLSINKSKNKSNLEKSILHNSKSFNNNKLNESDNFENKENLILQENSMNGTNILNKSDNIQENSISVEYSDIIEKTYDSPPVKTWKSLKQKKSNGNQNINTGKSVDLTSSCCSFFTNELIGKEVKIMIENIPLDIVQKLIQQNNLDTSIKDISTNEILTRKKTAFSKDVLTSHIMNLTLNGLDNSSQNSEESLILSSKNILQDLLTTVSSDNLTDLEGSTSMKDNEEQYNLSEVSAEISKFKDPKTTSSENYKSCRGTSKNKNRNSKNKHFDTKNEESLEDSTSNFNNINDLLLNQNYITKRASKEEITYKNVDNEVFFSDSLNNFENNLSIVIQRKKSKESLEESVNNSSNSKSLAEESSKGIKCSSKSPKDLIVHLTLNDYDTSENEKGESSYKINLREGEINKVEETVNTTILEEIKVNNCTNFEINNRSNKVTSDLVVNLTLNNFENNLKLYQVEESAYSSDSMQILDFTDVTTDSLNISKDSNKSEVLSCEIPSKLEETARSSNSHTITETLNKSSLLMKTPIRQSRKTTLNNIEESCKTADTIMDVTCTNTTLDDLSLQNRLSLMDENMASKTLVDTINTPHHSYFSTIEISDTECSGFKNNTFAMPTMVNKVLDSKRITSVKPGKLWRRSLALLRPSTIEKQEKLSSNSRDRKLTRFSIRVVPLTPQKSSRNATILENYAQINTSYAQSTNEQDIVANELLETGVRNLSLRDQRSFIRQNSLSIVTARDVVLRRCGQTEPLPFEKCYPKNLLKNCHKIGEGVYGEVFLYRNPKGGTTVMKVIPIEGDLIINGERQKKYEEIISEIIISMELSNLRKNKCNQTNGFTEVQKIQCVQGRYPEALLDLWDLYDENQGSENESPEVFEEDQLYIVLELANGGKDLEAYEFNNSAQAYSMFMQVACALAVAENELQFEHRDLHWGNILLSTVERAKKQKFVIDGKSIEIATKGVEVAIIDFTLSRIEFDSVVIFNDLGLDPDLFTAEGDYQFDIYRLMQTANKNNWQSFTPYSNILWLHYTLDKAINALRYKNKKSKIHKEYITLLTKVKEEILNYSSVKDFVLDHYM